MNEEEEEHLGEILLFYKYVKIEDVDEVVEWQRRICIEKGIRGRIRIASEGINGTVGGSLEAISYYEQEMRRNQLFHDIHFKRSAGKAENFDSLMVRKCTEIVSLGVDPARLTAAGAGKHLSPQEFHAAVSTTLLKREGESDVDGDKETVVLDCRNYYEARIGCFEGALRPLVRKFDEFVDYVDENAEHLKDKKVLMYCTGGIRCERGSAYLRMKGINDVYQLEGGIHCYLEEFPDGGHFKGKNLVFDKRAALGSQNPTKVGSCFTCDLPFDTYKDQIRCPCCRQLVLCCDPCQDIIDRISSAALAITNTGNDDEEKKSSGGGIYENKTEGGSGPSLSTEKDGLDGIPSSLQISDIIPNFNTLTSKQQELALSYPMWFKDFFQGRWQYVPLLLRCEACAQAGRRPGQTLRRPRAPSRRGLLPPDPAAGEGAVAAAAAAGAGDGSEGKQKKKRKGRRRGRKKGKVSEAEWVALRGQGEEEGGGKDEGGQDGEEGGSGESS